MYVTCIEQCCNYSLTITVGFNVFVKYCTMYSTKSKIMLTTRFEEWWIFLSIEHVPRLLSFLQFKSIAQKNSKVIKTRIYIHVK